jgi:hypothetical protein
VKIIRGRHNGSTARLVQFANDWISVDLQDGQCAHTMGKPGRAAPCWHLPMLTSVNGKAKPMKTVRRKDSIREHD